MNPSFTRRHFLKTAATAAIGLPSLARGAEDRIAARSAAEAAAKAGLDAREPWELGPFVKHPERAFLA